LGTLVSLVAVKYALIAADRISGSELSLGWQHLWVLGEGDAWKPWKWFSYAFLHADLYHALWNLLILHFVGHAWEDRQGHRSPCFNCSATSIPNQTGLLVGSPVRICRLDAGG
jgi:membrane associated rhomboid family serine protease